MAKKDRVGERFVSNEGYEMVIIEYNNANDLWIQFEDEYKAKVHTTYQHCKNGGIKNPYHPSVCKVGFIGQGEYKAYINRKATKCYEDWVNMLERCYDLKLKERCPTYKDCYVNKEAHCFQDFAEWWHNNYYEIEGERMCLDKDILVKGNKEYSFDTMIFVPQRINVLFVKNDVNRGNYPIGVCYDKENGKYITQCRVEDKRKYLGCYDTPEEAFLAYKQFKETYIKEIADEYKDKIPQRLYDAMYAWEVDIDD